MLAHLPIKNNTMFSIVLLCSRMKCMMRDGHTHEDSEPKRITPKALLSFPPRKCFKYMWHDQGKWVTCRKFQFQFSYTTFSKLQHASFWCKPHYNWMSGYRVMTDLTRLKTIRNKGIGTLFLPISQNQYRRHPTLFSWSCHIWVWMVKHIISLES